MPVRILWVDPERDTGLPRRVMPPMLSTPPNVPGDWFPIKPQRGTPYVDPQQFLPVRQRPLQLVFQSLTNTPGDWFPIKPQRGTPFVDEQADLPVLLRGAGVANRIIVVPPIFSVPPVLPPGPDASGNLRPVPRLPRTDDRTQRFSQIVQNILNGLIARGQLIQETDDQGWSLNPGGFEVNSFAGTVHENTDASTVIFDLDVANQHTVTLGGNRTLDVMHGRIGQRFFINLKQDAVGSRLVTWFGGIQWPGGTVPTLTTTALKTDAFEFQLLAAGVYLGFVLGQDL